jgi:chromosomal replication initiation ATPase DnaA
MTGEQFHFVFPQPVPPLEALFFGDEAAASIRVLRSWQSWPRPVLALTGPERSGVTTVLQSWSREVKGVYLRPADWMEKNPAQMLDLLKQPVALDDVEQVQPSSALLTFLNLAAKHGNPVVIGGHGNPGDWHSEPPDLVSRLTAAMRLVLPRLDDNSFSRRLRAACLRRFIDLPPETVKFVSSRLDQSYEAIEAFADQLNMVMGSGNKPASIPVARQILAALTQDSDKSDQIDS